LLLAAVQVVLLLLVQETSEVVRAVVRAGFVQVLLPVVELLVQSKLVSLSCLARPTQSLLDLVVQRLVVKRRVRQDRIQKYQELVSRLSRVWVVVVVRSTMLT
jgi:hypothetical protein